ncbi:MAG: IPT/TIG domain-containing protein [Acidimicrobiales bacterium]
MAAVFLPTALLVPVAIRTAVAPSGSGVAEKQQVAQAYAKLPLRFEANSGQTDADVRFVARAGGANVFLVDDGALLSLPGASGASGGGPVRMRPLRARAGTTPEGIDRLPGVSNYLLGNDPAGWHRGVPGYAGVRYREVYPGIDLVFHGGGGELEYDFVVAAGADPAKIALGFEGASSVTLDGDGGLVLATSAGEIRQRKPLLYQDLGGVRRPVDGGFVQSGPEAVTFRVGHYDRSVPLVIDPVLSFATLLGGSGEETGSGLEVDESGNPYVAGTTTSLDFPTTPGALDATCGNGTPSTCGGNAYVTKLTRDGSAVVYSTYIGGTGTDRGKSVAVDETGSAVDYGDTRSLDFPTTDNAFDRTCGNPGDANCLDVFVAKLTKDGSSLVYSTFVGGGSDDFAGRSGDTLDTFGGHGVDVTTRGGGFPSGAIWLTGTTTSADFPASAGIPGFQSRGFDLSCGTGLDPATGLPDGSCNRDAHFTDGSTSVGSTTLVSASARFTPSDVERPITGEGIPTGTVIASLVDQTTVVLSAAATADSSAASFTLVGRNEAQPDAFVMWIRWELSGAESLRYSTYLGGGLADFGYGLSLYYESLNGTGVPVVTGSTAGLGFPTSPGAYDRTCGAQSDPSAACPGGSDAFVASGFGTQPPSVSTYLGGSGDDAGLAVAADVTGTLYVTGTTSSPGFPTRNAFQAELAGRSSAFVTKLVPDASAIIFSTFLGGSGNRRGNLGGSTYGNGIAVDQNRNVFVSGTTGTDDFPTLDPVQSFAGHGTDAFLTKFAPSGSSVHFSTPLGGAGDESGGMVSLDAAGIAHVVGTTSDASTFPRPPGSTRSGPGGASEAFVVRLGPGTMPVVASVSPPGGSTLGGTPVVIAGSGLAGVTQVRFGETPAINFTVSSDSRIVATSPPREGATVDALTVSVTVSSPQGTSFTAVPFVYGEGAFHATASCLRVCPEGGAMVTLPNGKVLYASGRNSQLFDPVTATWSVTGSPGELEPQSLTLLPSGPASACGNNCGKVLATAGATAALYDPATGAWTPTGSMSVPRVAHTMTLLPNGKVLAAGGCPNGFCVFDFGTTEQSAELYDPLTGTWATTGSMTEPRWLHGATLIDPAVGNCGSNCGKVLVAFGAGEGSGFGESVATAELYDPSTGTWEATGSSLGTGRIRYDALQLGDGRVVTFGGEGAFAFGAPLDSMEVYDPVSETWALNSIMNSPRSNPRATLLPSGKILVVGPSGPTPADTAEIWNPVDNRWRSATTSAVASRHSPIGVALLPTGPVSACGSNCGKVLVAGGRGITGGDPLLGGAELYTPQAEISAITPVSGPSTGGTAVTITGTGLASVNAFPPYTGVRFGASEATGVAPDALTPDTKLMVTSPPGAAGAVDVRVTNLSGLSPASASSRFSFQSPQTTTTTGPGTGGSGTGGSGTGTTGTGTGTDTGGAGGTGTGVAGGTGTGVASLLTGYRLAAADGGVFAFGNLAFLGSTGGIKLASPVVGMAATPSKNGYWMVAADGGVFAFGDAKFFGSTGGIKLTSPVVGMAATPSGNGYWLVAADGGIFAFGDAKFFGSTGAIKLAQPAVGMARTPSGNGYWLVAKDGGIFAFGDARFFGSTGALRLAQPVVGMDANPSGAGYRLVAADGGVFAFGDAGFFGSTGALTLAQSMVGMAGTPSGKGYVLVARDGGIFAFGDAGFFGSTGALRLAQPVVAIAGG